MMTRNQREAAYAAIGILRRAGHSTAADAISQALADLHDHEVGGTDGSLSVGRLVLDIETSPTGAAPDVEETYVYWVVYAYREMSGGPQWLGACRVPRSTPILSCEDREDVALRIAKDTGRLVVLVSAEQTREGVEL